MCDSALSHAYIVMKHDLGNVCVILLPSDGGAAATSSAPPEQPIMQAWIFVQAPITDILWPLRPLIVTAA